MHHRTPRAADDWAGTELLVVVDLGPATDVAEAVASTEATAAGWVKAAGTPTDSIGRTRHS